MNVTKNRVGLSLVLRKLSVNQKVNWKLIRKFLIPRDYSFAARSNCPWVPSSGRTFAEVPAGYLLWCQCTAELRVLNERESVVSGTYRCTLITTSVAVNVFSRIICSFVWKLLFVKQRCVDYIWHFVLPFSFIVDHQKCWNLALKLTPIISSVHVHD